MLISTSGLLRVCGIIVYIHSPLVDEFDEAEEWESNEEEEERLHQHEATLGEEGIVWGRNNSRVKGYSDLRIL